MTTPSTEVDATHERRRLRPARRVLAVGIGLSLLGAAVVGLLGASGAGSLVAAFIGSASAVGAAGLVTLFGAVRDEMRGERVARRRIVIGVGLLLLAPLLLVLAAGAASTA